MSKQNAFLSLVLLLVLLNAPPVLAKRPSIGIVAPSSLVPLTTHLTPTFPERRRHTSTDACSSFSSAARPFTSNAILVRGGRISELPGLKTFAEAATICTGATAVLTYFAPATATRSLFGLPNTSVLVVWLVRALGGSLGMIAIQAYCTLFKAMTYTKAIGYGCLPFMINEIRTLVLNETRQWNMPPWGLLFLSLPISSSCAYTLISDKSFAKNVARAFAFWVLVFNGLPLGLAPEAAANGWGIDAEEEGVLESLQLIGLADIASAFFMVLLDRSADAVPAFASSFILLTVLMLKKTVPRLRDVQK